MCELLSVENEVIAFAFKGMPLGALLRYNLLL